MTIYHEWGVKGYFDNAHEYISVVRCKDCRYFKPELYNYITCEFLLYNMSADDFCSHGERKSEDD